MRFISLTLLAVMAFARTVSAAEVIIEGAPRRVIVPRIEQREVTYEYIEAHRMRSAGMALTITGIPLAVISGFASLGIVYGATPYDRNVALAGTALTGVISAALLATGIPLWVTGQSRIDRLRLSLNGGPAGSLGQGVTMAF